MLGSGAIKAMDETTDAVKAALRLVRFYARESCGKCPRAGRAPPGRSASCSAFSTVRVGPATSTSCSISPTTSRPAPTRSQPTVPGLDAVPFPPKQTTICPLGPSSVAPITSTIRRFRHEYEAKIGQAGFHPGDGRDVV